MVRAYQPKPAGAAPQAAPAPVTAVKAPAPVTPAGGNQRALAERRAEDLEAAAHRLHQALVYERDEAKVLALLANRSEAQSRQLEQVFMATQRISLRLALRSWLDQKATIKAYALLYFPDWKVPATDMALALIGRTRDDRVLQVMYKYDLATRKIMEQDYNRAFAQLGRGSLREDLKQWKLANWITQKALLLLDRDLTSADELYFDSVGIVGIHGDAVVARIHDEWSKGPEHFDKFVKDWQKLVDAGWAEHGLEHSIWLKMMNQVASDWYKVQPVFAGYRQWKAGKQVDPHAVTMATFQAVTAGILPDKAVVDRTVLELRRQRLGQMAAREAAGDAAGARKIGAEWQKEGNQIIAVLDGKAAYRSREVTRFRMIVKSDPHEQRRLPAGENGLNLADEVYLAWFENADQEETGALLMKAWAQEKTDDLIADLKQGHTVGGEVLRPPVPAPWLIGKLRYGTLLRPDLDQISRGYHQLRLELHLGDTEDELSRAYKFLAAEEVSADLRRRVIETYARREFGVQPSGAVNAFLNFLKDRFEDAPSRFAFADLLRPALTDAAVRERTDERFEANHSGVGNAITDALGAVKDAVTGEGIQDIEAEERHGVHVAADPKAGDTTWLEQKTGTASHAALVQKSYTSFVAAYNDVLSLKKSVTEAAATVLEIVVEVAISALTGGAAAGAFLASMASSVGGMVLRKQLLGSNYQLYSEENLATLLGNVAMHGGKALGSLAAETFLHPQVWKQLDRQGELFKIWSPTELSPRGKFVKEALSTVTAQALSDMLTARMPGPDQFFSTLLKSGVALGSGHLTASAQAKMQAQGRLVQAKIIKPLAGEIRTGGGNLLVDWATKGTGGKSFGELSQEMAGVLPGAFRSALVAAAGEARSEHVEERLNARVGAREERLRAEADKDRLIVPVAAPVAAPAHGAGAPAAPKAAAPAAAPTQPAVTVQPAAPAAHVEAPAVPVEAQGSAPRSREPIELPEADELELAHPLPDQPTRPPAGEELSEETRKARMSKAILDQSGPQTERDVPAGRTKEQQIFGKQYGLRDGTPTPELREWAQHKLPIGAPDPCWPNRKVTEPAQADHIIPRRIIEEMAGFAQLSEKRQLEVLNDPKNFQALSAPANASKSDLLMSEWKGHSKYGDIDPAFRKIMKRREKRARSYLKKRIQALLVEQLQENWANRFQEPAAPKPKDVRSGLALDKRRTWLQDREILERMAGEGLKEADGHALAKHGIFATEFAKYGIQTVDHAEIAVGLARDEVNPKNLKALIDRGVTLDQIKTLKLDGKDVNAAARLIEAMEPRLDPTTSAALLRHSSDENPLVYLSNLVKFERSKVPQYGELGKVLAAEGIKTPEQRALLRAAAQSGTLNDKEKAVLGKVVAHLNKRMAATGAGADIQAAVQAYAAQGDILRLAYLEQIMKTRAEGEAIDTPERFAKQIDPILQRHGVAAPGDIGAMKALPFEALPPQHRQAVMEVRAMWESEMRAATGSQNGALMHKEVAEGRIAGMIDPESPHNKANFSGYWTWDSAVAKMDSPAQAYHEMALAYMGTDFSPTAADRYFILARVGENLAQHFQVPLGPGAAAQAPELPAGKGNPNYPSTLNGLTAGPNLTPEWSWNGGSMPLPNGTRLMRRTAEGKLEVVAEVIKGRWQLKRSPFPPKEAK